MGKTGHLTSSLFTNYARNAKKRGVHFDLSRSEFLELIKQDCYICGAAPCNLRKSKWGELRYNGIDRVDNTIGYVSGNVMPCCWKCNSVKAKMDLSELKGHLRKMVRGLRGVL